MHEPCKTATAKDPTFACVCILVQNFAKKKNPVKNALEQSENRRENTKKEASKHTPKTPTRKKWS